MNRSILIILCLFLISLTQETNCQSNEQSLSTLLTHIKEKYEVNFSFESQLLDQYSDININTDNRSLQELLDQSFAKLGIHYLILNDNYILLRKNQVHQNTTNKIEGQIYSANTLNPLSYASVYLKNNQSGTMSNDQGEFSFLSPGNITNDTLVISYIGYRSQYYPTHQIDKPLTIKLEEDQQKITEVDIVVCKQDRLKEEDWEIDNLDITKISQAQFFGNDPLKSLQFIPGITKDASISDIRIRGSQGQNTLILLDEIPIIKIDHYYNIFSNINPLYITSTELYKNNIPVEYGGKTAGMVKMSNDSDQLEHFELESNMLSSSASTHLKLSPKLNLSASSRFSYVNLFDNSTSDFVIDKFELATDLSTIERLNEPFEPDFSFFDANFGLEANFSENHALRANFFISGDEFSFSRTRIRETKVLNILVEDTFTNNESWSNLGFSIDQQLKIGHNWKVKNVLYYSKYDNNLNLNKTLFQSNNSSNFDERFNANLDNELRTLGGKSVISGILNDRESILFGFELKDNQAVLFANENEEIFINSIQNDLDISLFQEFTRYYNNRTKLKLGFRASYLSLAESFFIQPNLSLQTDINKHFSLNTAYSRDVQGVAELGFENRIGQQLEYFVLANKDQYPASQADKIMAGFLYTKDRFLIDVEAYQKWQYDVLQLISLNANGNGLNNIPATRLYDFFVGDGKNQGIDILMSYGYKGLNSALSYSLSKSTHQFPDVYMGLEYLSTTDRRHQLQFIQELDYKGFLLSASYTYQTGNPYFDYSLLDIERDIVDPADIQAFLPDYHRFDLGVEYLRRFGNNEYSIGIQVLNVFDNYNVKFNHQASNIKRQDQSIGIIIGNESSMLERSYNLSLKFRFQ